jgi:predicted deacylase
VHTGPAVMHGELMLGPTASTPAAVALEHLVAVAGEVAAGMNLAPIASPAEPGTKQPEAATRTEEPGLIPRRRSTSTRRKAARPTVLIGAHRAKEKKDLL